MSYRKYIKEIEVRIAQDRQRGASELYSEAVAILEKFFAERHWSEEELLRVLSALVKAQPSMAPLLTLANRLLLAFEKGEGAVKEELERIRTQRRDFMERIKENACGLLKGYSKIMTVSYSSSVVQVLSGLKGCHIYIPEGGMAGFGIKTAGMLKKAGVSVTVVSDCFSTTLIKDMDVFVSGADAIMAGWVVNSCGTYSLAISAKEHQVPYMVLSELSKFLPYELQAFYEIRPTRYRRSDFDVLHQLFDRTPLEFVTFVVTEEKVMDASMVIEKIKAQPVSSLIVKLFSEGA